MAQFVFRNSTALEDGKLLELFRDGAFGWRTGCIKLWVRYSRGADFSGRCFYNEGRIFINLGRHLTYPYLMGTHLARAKTVGRRWYKPIYTVELADAYGVVLFVFMHELYHLLVRKARRNPRQKESMCDRFATRHVVSLFDATVCDEKGRKLTRAIWDYQDVEGFVAAARSKHQLTAPQRNAAVHPPLSRVACL